MDWLPGLVGAAITAFGAALLSKLRLSDRLRHRTQMELDILSKLPVDSPARDRLQAHIDQQLLLMVAEEEPLTAWERMDRRWGWIFYAFALSFGYNAATSQHGAIRYIWATLAGASAVWGFVRTSRVSRARQHRAFLKRIQADPPEAPVPAPTMWRMTLYLLQSLWPLRRTNSRSRKSTPPETSPPAST